MDTANKKRPKAGTLAYPLLMTGYMLSNQNTNNKKDPPRSAGAFVRPSEYRDLEPIINRLVYVPDPTGAHAPYAAFRTNALGMLYMLRTNFESYKTRPRGVVAKHDIPGDDGKPHKMLGIKNRFIVVPKEIVLGSLGVFDKNWAYEIGSFLAGEKDRGDQNLGNSTGTTLITQVVYKKHLRKPYPKPRDQDVQDTDEEYRDWYRDLKEDKKLHVFVLPKTRGIVFMFSNDIFTDATIKVWLPSKDPKHDHTFQTTVKKDKSGLVYATLFGTPADFRLPEEKGKNDNDKPRNLYTIKVELPRNFPNELPQNQTLKEKNYYWLKEKVRFAIRTAAGEFDIINCDPISLEESIMTQFSTLYADKIRLAKRKESAFSSPNDPQDPTPNQTEAIDALPEALDSWSKSMSWAYNKAKMSVAYLNDSLPENRDKMLIDLIYNELELSEVPFVRAAKKSIDLFYGLESLRGKWRNFIRDKLFTSMFDQAEKAVWSNLKVNFKDAPWLDGLKLSDDALIYRVKNLEGKNLGELKQLVVEPRKNKLSTLAEKTSKAFAAIDTGLSYYQTALSMHELVDAHKDQKKIQAKLTELTEDYTRSFSDHPSREGLGMLEKYRLNTIASRLVVDQKHIALINQAIDATLGTLALVPLAGAAAELMLTIKKAGGLLYDIYTLVLEAVSDEFERVIDNLSGATEINNDLAIEAYEQDPNDRGRHNLELQHRIRAEVLYSLVRLLLRASLDRQCRNSDNSLNLEKYKHKLRDDYRLQDFIRLFVLQDGWETALRPLIPVRLDTFWLSALGMHGHYGNVEDLEQSLGFGGGKPVEVDLDYPNSMYLFGMAGKMYDRLCKENVIASFQKPLPIHCMTSPDIDRFTEAFELTYDAVQNRHIVFSRVYYRKSDFDTRTDPDNLGWRPVKRDTRLTPSDHIRVIVVFKENLPKKLYPISLQINRIGPHTAIGGPLYKDFIKVLDEKELLKSEMGLKDRQGRPIKAGRLGCVLFPFYHYGNLLLAGIKPFGEKKESYRIRQYGKIDIEIAFHIKAAGSDDFEAIEINSEGQESCLLSIDLIRHPEHKHLFEPGYYVKKTEARSYLRLFTPPGPDMQQEAGDLHVACKLGPRHWLTPIDKGSIDELTLIEQALESIEGAKEIGSRRMSTKPIGSIQKEILSFAGKYRSGVGPVFVRIGTDDSDPGRFFLCTGAAYMDTITSHDFSWKEQVDLYVTFWTTHIQKETYQKVGLNWRSLPLDLSLQNRVGWKRGPGPSARFVEAPGPRYRADLQFCATLNPAQKTIWVDPGYRLRGVGPQAFAAYIQDIFQTGHQSFTNMPVDDLFDSSQSTLPREKVNGFIDQIDGPLKGYIRENSHDKRVQELTNLFDRDIYLYAAAFSLYYHRPGDHALTFGLRPFGQMPVSPRSFSLALRDLCGPPGAEIHIDKIMTPDGSELSIHFPAPKDGYDPRHAPWAAGLDTNERKHAIDRWIQSSPTRNEPEDGLIRS